MPFVARTRDAIRDSILANWASYYARTGRIIQTAENSHAWNLASALSIEQEALEAQALDLINEILPDKATLPFLLRHGAVQGVQQEQAVAAVQAIAITGTALATVTFGSAAFQAPNGGYTYQPTTPSVTLDGGGNGTVNATAQTAGAAGNLPSGTILTWTSQPVGANPTGTVTGSPVTTGVDIETPESYASRIIERMQSRPGSGNREDWAEWCAAVDGVEDVFVFPCTYQPSTGSPPVPSGAPSLAAPGCVVVCPMGPPQGSALANTRLLTAAKCQQIQDYIEGLRDRHGNLIPNGKQLRPATMLAGNYLIMAPPVDDLTNLEVAIVTAVGYQPTFATNYQVNSSSVAGGKRTVTLSSAPTDVHDGALVLVYTTLGVRGNFELMTVDASGVSGFTVRFTGNTIGTPVNSSFGSFRPGSPNCPQIIAAIYAYLDTLGPGDAYTTSFASPPVFWPQSARYPAPAIRAVPTLYINSVVAALIMQFDQFGTMTAGVRGVLDATTVTPAVDTTPPVTQLVTIDNIYLTLS